MSKANLSSAWQAFRWALHRDLTLMIRTPGEALLPLIFFFLVTSLFPLGLGSDPKMLAQIGAGVIWVCALLAVLLALPRLYTQDAADGTLEQMLIHPAPALAIHLGKVAAHWLGTGLPLVLVAPIIALQFNLASDEITVCFFSLLLGTPTLSLIGAVGSALSMAARGGAVLLALLVLPLATPTLIFGAGAVAAVASGQSPDAALSVLAALLLLSLVGAPLTIVAALRINLE